MEILTFYTCVPQITIIWCMVPELSSATDRIFCHVGLFFILLPPPLHQPRKLKFNKNEKKSSRYYHFTHGYHKWKSYVWFLRSTTDTFFSHFGPFFALLSPPPALKTQRTKILQKCKEKMLADIIILHKWTINDNHMISGGSWDMKHNRFFCHFGPFFALLPN